MRLTARGATDVGRVREENEDGFLVDERVGLYAVADGMGGHRAGEVASATALEALRASVAAGSAVRDAVLAANAAVHEKAAGDAELAGMGTTLTAATLAAGGTLLVAHVGDSRAYVLRDGELRQVTVDHSLVEELVREGRLTPEQATVHPHRSIITRALGVDAEVEVDLYSVELRPGDRVLLCSDGLTSMVRPDGVATVLRREDDAERAARALVDTANAAGGEDNITVVVVDVEDGDDPPAVAARPPRVEELPEAPSAAPPPPPPLRRRVTRRAGRLLLAALPVLVVVGVAVGAVGWFARRPYYVGLDGEQVALYRGVPGGLLWWDPTLEERADLTTDDLTEAQLRDLDGGHRFSSRSGAEAFVARLERDAEERDAATTTTVTTTAPDTAPPTTATPADGAAPGAPTT